MDWDNIDELKCFVIWYILLSDMIVLFGVLVIGKNLCVFNKIVF